MQLTTDQVAALLRLVAELTEQRDTAHANYQRLNREWDEYEQRAQIEKASQPDPGRGRAARSPARVERACVALALPARRVYRVRGGASRRVAS